VAYVATGAPAKAIQILSDHLGGFPRPAADVLLARAYDAAGESEKSLAAYSDIYYRYPASPEADETSNRKADF